MFLEGKHGAGRNDESEEAVAREEEHGHHWQRVEAEAHDGKHRRHGEREGCDRHPHHPDETEAFAEPSGHLRHGEERHRVDREGDAVLRRRQVEMVNQHEGRIREIDEEARNAEAADEGQRQEVPVGEKRPVGLKRTADPALGAGGPRTGLLHLRREQNEAD